MSYLTVKDVAARWSVRPGSVMSCIRDGRLRAMRIGHQLRVRPQDLPGAMPPKVRKPRAARTDLPKSGVYMLLLAGQITYIGRSTELPRRITNHRRSGRAFDEVRAIPCAEDVANWLEAELIRTLQPPENIKRFARRAQRIEAVLGGLLQ